MEVWESTRAEVLFNLIGTDQYVKQSLSDLNQTVTEEEVIALGELLETIVSNDYQLDSTVIATRKRYIA